MSDFISSCPKPKKEVTEIKDQVDCPGSGNDNSRKQKAKARPLPIEESEEAKAKPLQIEDSDAEKEDCEPWFEGEDDSDSKVYGQGGYLRVKLGDTFNRRYTVEQKLGWGHFSTVWLATDSVTDRLVALKIQKSAVHYTEAALDEIELLSAAKQKNNKANFVVQLLDHFDVQAINGRHFVFVFELLGPDLLSLIKRYSYQGLPIAIVKQISKQVLVGLDNMHTKYKIIHTDLKPENVLLFQPAKFDKKQIRKERDIIIKRQKIRQYNKLQALLTDKQPELSKTQKRRIKVKTTRLYEQIEKYKKITKGWKGEEKDAKRKQTAQAVEKNIKDSIFNEIPKQQPEDEKRLDHSHFPIVKIADLGNACWTHQHFTDDITTCQYRAPEAILGQKYGPPVDIWSLATMIFELVTGDYLFNPKEDRDNRYTKDEDHLAQISELCGRFKKPFTQKGSSAHNFFNRKGELRHIKKLEIWPLLDVLRQKYKKKEDEAELLASFLSPMLEYNPNLRATAKSALSHPWLRMTQEDWDNLLVSEKDMLHEGYESEMTATSNLENNNQELDLKQIQVPTTASKNNKSGKLKIPRARTHSV